MIIGVLCPSTSEAINFYRASGAFLPMMGRYKDLAIMPLHGRSNFQEAFNYIDVLFINNPVPARPGDPTFLRMAQDAKARGIKVWFDYDDYFLDVHPYSPSFSHFNIPEVRNMIKAIMNEADIVTTATEFLKDTYESTLREMYGNAPEMRVVPNAWNDFMLDLAEETTPGKKYRVAWRGSSFHTDDIYSVHEALNAYMDDFRFTIYGGNRHPFLNPNHLHVGWMPLQQYFTQFCNAKLDFLLTPLLETNFNRAKSNIAWIEATIAGAVCVAPVYLPEFEQPGVIHYAGEKGFTNVLKGIKEHKYDKRALLQQSREALEDFRLSRINDLRFEIAEKLVFENKLKAV